MLEDDLSFMSATEMSERIASREISPFELVESQLERIARLDPVLQSYISINPLVKLQARLATDEIRTGHYRGKLHGIPVAHKDHIDVMGMVTTGASRSTSSRVKRSDSRVSSLLRAQGSICLGKLNMVELGCGSMGMYGHTRNPWDLSAYPGGSSSGTGAAVAMGLATLGTGTDTGGSIRMPAAFCGIVGVRPTFGRVSMDGILRTSWGQDTVGPMCRTVEDAGLILEATSELKGNGSNYGDSKYEPFATNRRLKGLSGVRIGIHSTFYCEDLVPEVERAFWRAVDRLEALGARLAPVDLDTSRFASAASWAMAYTETFMMHRRSFDADRSRYTPAFFRRIAATGLLSVEDRRVCLGIRDLVEAEFAEAFGAIDVIVTPTSRTLPPDCTNGSASSKAGLLGQGDMASLLRPISLVGRPAMSVPMGTSKAGTPIGLQLLVGLQLLADRWEESMLLRVGYEFEQSTRWHRMRPPQVEGLPPGAYTFGTNIEYPAPCGLVTSSWVLDESKRRGYEFISEEDAYGIAKILDGVKAILNDAPEASSRSGVG